MLRPYFGSVRGEYVCVARSASVLWITVQSCYMMALTVCYGFLSCILLINWTTLFFVINGLSSFDSSSEKIIVSEVTSFFFFACIPYVYSCPVPVMWLCAWAYE